MGPRLGTEALIPRALHAVWVGDPARCPREWLRTWQDQNPGWDFTLWGNEDFGLVDAYGCRPQLDLVARAKRWEGVADILRYAVLHRFGGVYFDADSVAVRPINPDWLTHDFFACYESERHFPGMIANSFIGAEPGHPILAEVLARISKVPDPLHRWSNRRKRPQPCPCWMSLGPLMLTRAIGEREVLVLPSETFTPQHRLDAEERAGPGVYARHFGHERAWLKPRGA